MNSRVALFCGVLSLMIGPALADAPPSKVTRVFEIMREGTKIGTDVVDIEKQGDQTTVRFKTHISVVVLIEVYHYDHTSTETWKGNQLVSFKSQTDDNGKKHAITATTSGEKLQFEIDGKRSDVPKTVLPASFWARPQPGPLQMFDETTGKRISVKVSDLGDESMVFNGAKHQVRHFHVSGDMERDLWFDGDTLLRLKMAGTDGSKIVSDLQP